MKRALALTLTTLAGLMLSACGSALPTSMMQRQMQPTRALQAQRAPQRSAVNSLTSKDVTAQYFSVLLDLQYTPDGGIHFGFDRVQMSFADSKAKHIKLNLTWSLHGSQFMLNLERSGLGMPSVSERVLLENLARRAEIAAELRLLSGSNEDNAVMARMIQVIAPQSR